MEDTMKKSKPLNTDLYEFIKIRLDNFDKSNKEYAEYIKIAEEDSYNFPIKLVQRHKNNKIIFSKNNEIIFEDYASILGIFDIATNVWLWAWTSPSFTQEEIKDSLDILKYSLSYDPKSNSNIHRYIKSHFTCSRIHFDKDIYFVILNTNDDVLVPTYYLVLVVGCPHHFFKIKILKI
jgi:hypothetical protein